MNYFPIHNLTEKLHAAGLTSASVSIGTRADKSTWRIQWSGTPTAEQIATAAGIIAAFDIPTEEAKAVEAEGTSRAEVIARGIGRVLVAKGVCTQAEIKAAIKAEWEAGQ